MGAVYKGIQPELERPVAIKLLPAEVAADEGFVTIRTTPERKAGEKEHDAMSRQKPPGKPPRRKWIIPTAVAALLLAGLGLGVWQKWGNSPTAPNSISEKDLVGATNETPFINSLGMKFVPVPISGGPTDGKRVLFSVWDTRVQDYEVFANATYHKLEKPDFEQGPTHPVVMVSWDEAQAFCSWLTEHEHANGKLQAIYRYRLPSDHEWSNAVGIGEVEDATQTPWEKNGKIDDAFPWGSEWPPPVGAGNYAGEESRPLLKSGKFPWLGGVLGGYRDGYPATAPVGSFVANRFGLYDLGGNVWQWCEDRPDASQDGHVIRGTGWNGSERNHLLSSVRAAGGAAFRNYDIGFRCVLDALPGTAQPEAKPHLDLKEGLIAWWKADGDARDSVGSHHGTPRGNVSFAEGLFGQAFLLKGGYIEVPAAPDLSFDSKAKATISLWAYRTGKGIPYHIFGKRVGCQGDGNSLDYQLGIGGDGPDTPVNEWVFWTIVNHGDFASLYVNGKRNRNWRKFGPVNSAALKIGGCGDCAGFEGMIDDFRIYNRALSSDEIRAMFESQKAAVEDKKKRSLSEKAKAIAPVKTPGRNYKGEPVDQFAWVGDHFVFLTVSDQLKPEVMGKLVDMYGTISQFYRDALQDEIGTAPDYQGRAMLIEDATCGGPLNASYGSAVCRVVPVVFGRIYGAAVDRDELEDWGFYWALSVNHWNYGAQLIPKDSPYSDAFGGGFGVVMRLLTYEVLAGKFATFKMHGGPELRSDTEALLDLYLSDPKLNFENTFGAKKAPKNPKNLGVGDFCAAFCLRLCRDNGGPSFNGKLWREVAKRPEAKTPQDGVDNFILSACAAAGKDLSGLFTHDWRWPMSQNAVKEAKSRWGAAPTTLAPAKPEPTLSDFPPVTSTRNVPSATMGTAPTATTPPAGPKPIAATKDQPFVNSLGMKFVPVPITGGPTAGKKVLFSIWDTRVQDYAEYAHVKGITPETPGFAQGPTHPVVMVSWDDAKSFCAWLTAKERASGKIDPKDTYRLPSDHEWSCAVGIGRLEKAEESPESKKMKIEKIFPWGTWPPPIGCGNLHPMLQVDDFQYTSSVGSFPPNEYGLYDMAGNVYQWCEDWYNATHDLRVIRGTSWGFGYGTFESSFRDGRQPHLKSDDGGGFRCVLDPAEP